MRHSSTGIKWTRDGMKLRPVAQHSWPTYLVSAQHSQLPNLGTDELKRPYGLWHARQVGSLRSACGRSAVTWQFFWTLDFAKAGTAACPECVTVLATTE